MKRSRAVLVALAVSGLALLQAKASQAQASPQTQSNFVAVTLLAFVPCAVDGEGEWVEFAGQFHVLTHTTQDAAGGFHEELQSNPVDFTGTGQTTGDTYLATGARNTNLKFTNER